VVLVKVGSEDGTIPRWVSECDKVEVISLKVMDKKSPVRIGTTTTVKSSTITHCGGEMC
jgi:hypothetical protein